MKFVKMHGLGNDFVVVEGPTALTPGRIAELCDRRTGIGADGVLAVSPVSDNVVKMDYWNADGSHAEMCGNGLRCVTRYAIDQGWLQAAGGHVDSAVGRLAVSQTGTAFKVEVGAVTLGERTSADMDFQRVSVGNPHAVTFVDDVDQAPVAQLGSHVEQATPGGTNVEFAQAIDDGIRVRTWERGVGETLACGTGAVATAAAARHAGMVGDQVTIHLLGGPLTVDLDGDAAYITGPAEYVFSGSIESP